MSTRRIREARKRKEQWTVIEQTQRAIDASWAYANQQRALYEEGQRILKEAGIGS